MNGFKAAPPAPTSPVESHTEPLVLTTLLESLLFVAGEPVAPADLARALALPEAEIQEGLSHLGNHYKASGRGLRLQVFNDKVQLVTAPAAASYIESFLKLETTTRLSGPALETLAVIAYRQPVTRAQIEAIRGVDCATVLRSLTQRGLVAEAGRLETVGRPILYSVTELFMQHFGLVDLGELPPLEEGEADRLRAASVLAEQDKEDEQEE
jgi:segregation and condensation protein B